tara:strand:- start:188 stop:388 length:201 start_codon:yes stop_codon:yes gene_type:complete
MSILNYFFIGTVFTFIIDLLLSMERIKTHPAVKDKDWGIRERIICVIVWPLSTVIFLIAFIKQFFK